MASISRKTVDASPFQPIFLAATWVAGIYVNGFVSILPWTAASAILLEPAVDVHVALATLSAAIATVLLFKASALLSGVQAQGIE